MKLGIDLCKEWQPRALWAGPLEGHDNAGRIDATASTAPEKEKARSRPKTERHAVLRVARRYDAPPARVFDAWLNPVLASHWLFATASRPLVHVEIDARVEGSFRFVDRLGDSTEYTGRYIEIVPPRRLVFTLSTAQYAHISTRVTVEIAPLAKGCKLTLIHENVPRDHAEEIEGRWTGVLYGLGMTLDPTSTPFHHDQE